MSAVLSYRPRRGDIPTNPGVYRFLDGNERVLYVGKAKNLRARLSSYFAPLEKLHERTRRMVTTARNVEWTVVGSEVEALQLEFTWINEFDPPFNVQFRDDKSYPYIAVTLGEEAPRVVVTRRRNMPGAKYFGPYPRVWAVYETLDLLRTMFPLRTCKDSDYRAAMKTGKPCFASQIGRCAGPCSHKVSVEQHREAVLRFVAFMSSQDRRIVADLRTQMKRASDAQDYEKAARLRDQLLAAETFFERSAVVLRENVDIDVIGFDHDELSAAVQLFIVRSGRIRGVRAWTVDTELDVDDSDLVEDILQNAYDDPETIPSEIVVPVLPQDPATVEEWLSGVSGRKVSLRASQRGEKAALLETATLNAKHALMSYKTQRANDFTTRSRALEDLQEALELAEAPLRIECFDVSHLGGTNMVASMVVFEDGLAKKNAYRRFNIIDARDDTEAMFQVITRRLAHLEDDHGILDDQAPEAKFSYRPQLILVDGGLPQVNAAQRAIRDSGITNIAVVGIAKRLEELWLPNSEYPVILPRNSDALYLVQRARDEAHRFAISHQRGRRRRDIRSVLGEIPGLGPQRISALLKHFGSVARLKTASVEELSRLSGIGPQLAETIVTALSESPRTTETPRHAD